MRAPPPLVAFLTRSLALGGCCMGGADRGARADAVSGARADGATGDRG
ncbi:MAG: hypothetical protein M3Y87_06175 [Myxococcota bacterium]|nr:hypothetical protein [Myxococcota bacterium]